MSCALGWCVCDLTCFQMMWLVVRWFVVLLQRTIPVLLCTTKYYSSTTLYYKVLLQYYSALQRTTPVLLSTTKYYARTTTYYSRYYSVLQSTTPVLLCTTKYYSSTTLYYKELCQYYPVLLSNVLLQYYSSTTLYYKVLLQYYKVLLQYYNVLLQYYSVLQSTTPVLLCTTRYYNVLLQYYSVLQSTTPVLLCTTPVLQRTTPVLLCTTKYYASKVLLRYYSVLQSTTPVLLGTTKYYSSTTLYYKVLRQYYSVLQRTTPVLLSTTKYYASTTTYYSGTTLKRHSQCAAQQESPSNFTKYCACHAKWMSSIICVTYETSFPMRGASKVTLQPHQILRLPRKMQVINDLCHIWNVISNARSKWSHPPTSPNAAPATQKSMSPVICDTYQTSFPMRGASKGTLQPHQILRLPRKMQGSNDLCHIWNVITNARSKWSHPPTSPNAAPATENQCHQWSATHIKRHFQCAEQAKAPCNLTKYCACDAKCKSAMICVTYETSFPMRGAGKVTLQTHQILRLPRNLEAQDFSGNSLNASANRKTIRAWSEDIRRYPTIKSSSRTRRFGDLTRPILETVLYCKIQHFASRLSPKMWRSAAPVTKSHPPTSPNTAPATQNELWTVTWLICYFTELLLDWSVTLLNCYLTDLLLYWTVTLLNCYLTDLLLYWTVTLLNCYFTELLLDWSVTLLNCYFTELLLYWTVTLLNCYLTDLLLYWTVTLLNCYLTDLLLYWTVTLLNCYFTELLLDWSVTLLNCYFTELLLYWTVTWLICYFTELLLYWSVTLLNF